MSDLRSLRDDLDRARNAATQNPSLENSHRSRDAWQALRKAVQEQGPNPSFLTYQLKGDSDWLVQVLWPDGFEEYAGRFESELAAQRWIDEEASNWLSARQRFHEFVQQAYSTPLSVKNIGTSGLDRTEPRGGDW